MKHLYYYGYKTNGFIKNFWLLAMLLSFSLQANAQCPSGNVFLLSQADVNNFKLQYPNCTGISGFLHISGGDITDLLPLGNIKSVGGFVDIYNNQLTNLNGLEALRTVGSYINIEHNSLLNNLNGLGNVSNIGRSLVIIDNSNLSTCNSTFVCNYLKGSGSRMIYGNGAGCESANAILASCTPACEVPANITTSNVISNKATINWTNSGTFDIEWGIAGFTQGTGTKQNGVSALNYTITGLTETTSYDVYVRQNCTENQSDWVKHTFSTISICPIGNVTLSSQKDVDDFGAMYPNCTQTTGYLLLQGDITDLSPLSKLQSIGTHLGIYETQLTNLNGLSALKSINGSLEIGSNLELSDISGLRNISSDIINLIIVGHPNLSVCNIASVCSYLQTSGTRDISDNATGCQNENEVKTACTPCTKPTQPTATDASVYTGATSAILGATGIESTITETIDLGSSIVVGGNRNDFVELSGSVSDIPSGATVTSAKLVFNGVTTSGGVNGSYVLEFYVSVSGTATTLAETPLANVDYVANGGPYNLNLASLTNGAFTVKIRNNFSFGNLTINSVKLEYTYTDNLPLTINWYDGATSGTALATGTTYEVTNTTQLNTPGTYTYYATADNGTCESERTAVTLTVNPALTMYQPANQEVIHGDNTEAVTFTSAAAGVTYDWTNNTTSIGLPASGTGNIPSFVANNTTGTAVTATITVTPKNIGMDILDINQASKEIPMASFDQGYLAQSFKAVSNSISGAGVDLDIHGGNSTVTIELWDKLPNQTGAIKLATGSSPATPDSSVDVSWSPVSVTPGTTYYLVFTSTNNNNVLLGNFDTPYVDGQMYANAGYDSFPDLDFAFRVYKSGTIIGAPKTFTIKVKPGLTMDQPANQEVRHGDNTEAVTFTSAVSGVTYDWTNNTTSIGLPASGTGNIPSFVANNTTGTAVTATITVTPKIVIENIVDINQPIAEEHISNFDIPLAQSFKAVSNSISGAGIKLSLRGGNSTVTVELWDKLPNQTGAIKLSTGSSTATPNSWVDVSWSPVSVTPGTTYYLVFKSTDEGNGMMGSLNTYADGQVYVWPEYFSYPYVDFAFRVYNSAGTTTTGTPKTFTIKVNPDITLNVSDINKKSIAVYPNPFTEVINLSDINLIESITVNDVSGKLIKTIKPTKEINFSNSASGTYIINVRFKDGDTKSFKVIKK
ncbi:T9SS type A sorting domain-containing protein [Chryseobacterium sp. FH1]|uniref:Ig-like domain-containing protein n=1 Tax=Chryseobacterium sp. FH1 TaxID=1233951 RepID=UPI000690FD42|nr:T9SS type A sorting domain-containing protein [Chryseobacterium sp. FH1]